MNATSTSLSLPESGIDRFLTGFLKIAFSLYVVSLGLSISGMELFAVLVTLGVAVHFGLHLPKRFADVLPPAALPVAIFALIAMAGILLGRASPQAKLYDLGRMRFFFLYFILFYYLKFVDRSVGGWLRPLFWVGFIVGIYGFVQHFVPLDLVRPAGKKVVMYSIPDEKLGPLVLGTFNHHLTFASVYFFSASIFAALGLYARPRRIAYLVLGALLFLLCWWTQSRTAWVAVPIGIGILLYPKGRHYLLGLIGFVILGGGATYLVDAGFRERFNRTFQDDEIYSLSPRSRLWQLQWVIFKESPLLGIGYNNNERFARQYFHRAFPEATYHFYGHAHSNILQVLSTTGLLGLTAFFAIWWIVFRNLWRGCKSLPRSSLEGAVCFGLWVAFIGFHIQGLTQWNFGDAEVLHNVIFFWAVAGNVSESV